MKLEAPKSVKVEYGEAVQYIMTCECYFIGVHMPAGFRFNQNPQHLRTAMGKRLLQIIKFCTERNVKVCAILPEQDIGYYVAMFNMAGIETWAMMKSDPVKVLTDHYVVVPEGANVKEIYESCSCVFILNDAEEPIQDEITDGLENENVVFFNVPKEGELRFTDSGSPQALLNAVWKDKVIRNNVDPYATFPDINENIVRKVPLTFIQDMMDNMPQHTEPRVLVTSKKEKR